MYLHSHISHGNNGEALGLSGVPLSSLAPQLSREALTHRQTTLARHTAPV
jgi:hypothetical protein